MLSTSRSVPSLTKLFAAVALITFAFSAFGDPAVGVLDQTDARVQSVIAAQDEVTPALMERPEILGTAVGVSETGNPTLMVYVNRDAPNVEQAVRTLPREVRGTPVRVELMDEVRAMGNTAKQTPPISLGTSGGWTYDSANGYCCGGTSRRARTDRHVHSYVLSACHVLEGDTVLGGNNRIAQTGDPVIQPGLIDEQCNRNLAQTVGTLLKKRSLATSNTDCAVATVVGGMVRTDGAILGIGTISHNTSAASLNQHVKKSGRTSGLTHSHVSGLNATVRVAFTNECNGGTYYKNFSGQIVVANSSSSFLKAGDSGSFIGSRTLRRTRARSVSYLRLTTPRHLPTQLGRC